MPFMYIIECSDGSYYTGIANNLEYRINKHNSGVGAKYTRGRLPVKLLYYEEYNNIEDALKREKEIQRWTRKKKEELIKSKKNKA